MTTPMSSYGRLIKIYGIHPAYMQRAVFVAVLSFIFFLAMMFAFYLRQHFGYFLLSTAFLLVYLATLFSWVMQRRNVVKVSEFGFEYRKFACTWAELMSVERSAERNGGIAVNSKDRKTITIPSSINGIEEIEAILRRKLDAGK
jgi:hypothetical protein